MSKLNYREKRLSYFECTREKKFSSDVNKKERNVLSGSKRSCNMIICIRQRHLQFHSLTRKLSNGYVLLDFKQP